VHIQGDYEYTPELALMPVFQVQGVLISIVNVAESGGTLDRALSAAPMPIGWQAAGLMSISKVPVAGTSPRLYMLTVAF
jgi:hypothetical protein